MGTSIVEQNHNVYSIINTVRVSKTMSTLT